MMRLRQAKKIIKTFAKLTLRSEFHRFKRATIRVNNDVNRHAIFPFTWNTATSPRDQIRRTLEYVRKKIIEDCAVRPIELPFFPVSKDTLQEWHKVYGEHSRGEITPIS